MPCDYRKYPKNWKSEIRPSILQRANNCCEVCKAKNGVAVFRGIWKGIEVFQDIDANIYRTDNGEWLCCDPYEPIEPSTGNENQKAVRIVLTIAHLDHDAETIKRKHIAKLVKIIRKIRFDKSYKQTSLFDFESEQGFNDFFKTTSCGLFCGK